MVRHVSFDLWKTIITSNKNFSKERLHFLCNDFITKEFSFEQIENALKQTSPIGDLYGEFFQVGFTPKQLYYLFLYNLYGKETTNIINETNCLQTLYDKTVEIMKNNPPHLISNEIVDVLERLKEKKITTNIASNTSFAGGEHLRTCLSHHNISKYFKFEIFSDEIGYFKPNHSFFEAIYFRLQYLDGKQILLKNVLHVGDNPYADIKGASAFGFQTLLFTPETPNYNEILDYV